MKFRSNDGTESSQESCACLSPQVPFGNVATVRDWMKISGPIGKPAKEHPKRPILGLGCQRSEPSGQRFWSMFSQLCGTPERFFQEAYVHNYCPVAYMDFKGKNITPVDMKVAVTIPILLPMS